MNRIDAIFRDLTASGKRALMPFLTAGYPSLDATAHALKAAQAGGASICELGIPFSDPVADGPVIQASMTAALETGVTPAAIFDMVRSIRHDLTIGLVAMVSYSIVHRTGVNTFMNRAQDAGFDGLIIPDLSLESAHDVAPAARDAGLTLSLLVAPTTPLDRAKRIADASTGFLYVLARAGLTGERAALPENLTRRLEELHRVTDLPLAVGFGIGAPDQVRLVTQHAEAAIVGSALVKRMGQAGPQGPHAVGQAVQTFVAELATGLTR